MQQQPPHSRGGGPSASERATTRAAAPCRASARSWARRAAGAAAPAPAGAATEEGVFQTNRFLVALGAKKSEEVEKELREQV
mgnify:CR=1 FL=1